MSPSPALCLWWLRDHLKYLSRQGFKGFLMLWISSCTPPFKQISGENTVQVAHSLWLLATCSLIMSASATALQSHTHLLWDILYQRDCTVETVRIPPSDPRQPMWAVRHLQLFTVQKSEELSLPFVLAQHGTWQFSLRCRHSYASVVSPPSPCLCESGTAHYSEAPTALCGSVSCKHYYHVVRLNCALIASASAAAPRLHPLQLVAPRLCSLWLLFPNYFCFSCCSSSVSICDHTQYRHKYEGHVSLLYYLLNFPLPLHTNRHTDTL